MKIGLEATGEPIILAGQKFVGNLGEGTIVHK